MARDGDVGRRVGRRGRRRSARARTALDEVDPELGLTLEVHPSLVGYDLAGLTADGAADRAIIMGYEYRGDGAATTGSQAPLTDDSGSDLRTTIDGALAQVGGDKLIVALPWYGRAWSADSPEPGAATVSGEEIDGPATVDYDAAVLQAIESGREYATGQESAWTAYVSQDCVDCPPTWRQLWYDDHDSFGAKLDHALGAGLAGVGIWALGFDGDRPELWSALRQRAMRTVDEQAPNGSASLEPSAGTGERSDLTVVEGSAPILTFASDEPQGSGLAFVRVSLVPDLADDGTLAAGRTYPASRAVNVPLGDPAIGGTDEPGPRDIHVQWRDVAGNWSAPLVISVWAADPDEGVTLPATDGPELVVVGDYSCQALGDVRPQVESVGLMVGTLIPEDPPPQDSWLVHGQLPPAGESVPVGSAVDLHLADPVEPCPSA